MPFLTNGKRYLIRAQSEGRYWLAKPFDTMAEVELFSTGLVSLCPEAKISLLDLATGELVVYYPRAHTEKGPHSGARQVEFV